MKQTEKQVVMELNQNSILNKKKILIIDDETILVIGLLHLQ